MTIEHALDEIADIIPGEISQAVEPMRELANPIFEQMNNPLSLLEVGIAIAIVCVAYFLQKWLWRLSKGVYSEGKTHRFAVSCGMAILTCAAPLLAFILFFIAMSVGTSASEELGIFELGMKLTQVWFVWLVVMRTISDLFVRCVVAVTLMPVLILYSLGYGEPVISYLDSLGITLGGIRITLFLLLKGVFIATCLFWLGRLVSSAIVALIRSQDGFNEGTRELLIKGFQIILYSAIVLITLNILGIDLTVLALFGGAIGVGIGFGLQKIAANFISGIILLLEQSVKTGHLVEVDGGVYGWVRHLGARATVIEGLDGREVLVPNEELISRNLTNWTYSNTKARIELIITISFTSDIEKARQIMLEVLVGHPRCADLPPPACYLTKFGESGLEFLLHFWVDDVRLGKVRAQSDLLFALWQRFKDEGIEIPNPQYDVRIV